MNRADFSEMFSSFLVKVLCYNFSTGEPHQHLHTDPVQPHTRTHPDFLPGGSQWQKGEGFHAWPSLHSFVSPFTPALILLTYLVILEQATYNTSMSASSTLKLTSAAGLQAPQRIAVQLQMLVWFADFLCCLRASILRISWFALWIWLCSRRELTLLTSDEKSCLLGLNLLFYRNDRESLQTATEHSSHVHSAASLCVWDSLPNPLDLSTHPSELAEVSTRNPPSGEDHLRPPCFSHSRPASSWETFSPQMSTNKAVQEQGRRGRIRGYVW